MEKSKRKIGLIIAVMLLCMISSFAVSASQQGVRYFFKINGVEYYNNGNQEVSYNGTSAYNVVNLTVPEKVTYGGTTYTVTWIESLYELDGTVETISIPKTVSKITGYDPYYFESLKTVNVSSENPAYCSVDGVLYDKDMTEIIIYPNAKAEKVFVVPDTVKRLSFTFSYAENLTTVIVPDSVEYINGAIFNYAEVTDIYYEGTEEMWDAVCSKEVYQTVHFGHEHSDLTVDVIKEADCITAGIEKYYCACGAVVSTKSIPAKGHSFISYVYDENATCTKDGTKTASCANGCGTENTVTEYGSATGHAFTNYVYDGNATCSKDGTKTAKCDNGCGETDSVTAENTATKHIYKATVTKKSTCYSEGILTYTCSGCYDSYNEKLPLEECIFEYYIDDNNATCTENGTKTAECEYGCKKTHTIIIENSALNHSFTNYISDKNATCTEDGTKTAYCDNGCGEKNTATDKNSAAGHKDAQNDNICDACGEEIEDLNFFQKIILKIRVFFMKLFGLI